MDKKDYYNIEKNIDKINRGEYTNFLDQSIYKKICYKLKKYNYNIYYPYKDSDKLIIYTKASPEVKLLEILSYDKLTHREIMGSLYGLNINSEMFGDIIIWNDHYYIIVMSSIYDLVLKEYNKVGNHHIKIKEQPIEILDNYIRTYQSVELIVSSLRIDQIISKIIGTSRENVKDKFKNNEVILNYEICHKLNYNIHKDDVFSIRKYGKYKYIDIIKQNKKGNYLIKLDKYIDN